MTRFVTGLALSLILGGAIVAQESGLPSTPPRQFGASVTGAFDGWFDNADGSRSLLVGYYSRNTRQVIDVPIGPNNRIEPGGPDLGQPTHFLPGRNVGMFTVRVPRGFTPPQELVWTLTVNGQTTRIPLRTKPDYFVSPMGGGETGNVPPVVRFTEHGPAITGPVAHTAVLTRTTTVGTPLPLTVWVTDDARYNSATGVPARSTVPPIAVHWTKYRGAGEVQFTGATPPIEVLAGGTQGVPYAGRSLTEARFSAPGEYLLHLTVNDYSGEGGGGEVCCWTSALVGVTVTP